MEDLDKKLILKEDGTYRYVLENSSKYEIKVVFIGSVNSKAVEKEITTMLKNNYIERTLSSPSYSNGGDSIL